MYSVKDSADNKKSPTPPSHLFCIQQQLLPPVGILRLGVLSQQILGHLAGRELSLTDVAKVTGQVDRLALD